MTTTTSAPATLGPMTGFDLVRMITAVVVHTTCEGEAVLEELTHVSCEVDRGHMYMAATDRYTLGIIRNPLPDGHNPGRLAITLPAAALRRLAHGIERRAEVTVQVDPTGLTVHDHDSGLRHHLPASPLEYCVRWRRLLGRHMAKIGKSTPGGAPVTLNSAYLARFAHAAAFRPRAPKVRWPLEFHTVPGERAPLLVTCGTHFLGAIMPMLPAAGADSPSAHLADWQADCPPPARARKAA